MELQRIAEKHIDSAVMWRTRAMNLQRELVSIKGACPVSDCVRHLDHRGPCMEAEVFDD